MTARTSHEAYASNCSQIAQAGRVGGQAVQVQKRGATLCGRVVELGTFQDGREAEWFRVETPLGRNWFPAPLVRLCDGVDGRCQCS